MRDSYLPSFFFLKGLPSATLVGVKNNGFTNSEVDIYYDKTADALVFRYINGQLEEFHSYLSTEDTMAGRLVLVFLNNDTMSNKYLVRLVNKEDYNLFNEYTFTIDTIPPTFTIRDINSKDLDVDSWTIKPFLIYWDEVGAEVYYVDSKVTDTFSGAKQYFKDTVITKDGYYLFRILDKIGNYQDFYVFYDSKVDYTFKGKYKTVLGKIISNDKLSLVVNEEMKVVRITNEFGYIFQLGDPIQVEGEYLIYLEDLFGNIITFTIIIDFTPPLIYLNDSDTPFDTTNTKLVVNTDVWFKTNEGGSINIMSSAGKVIKILGINEHIKDTGTYTIMAQDSAGNETTIVITIDKTVLYTLSISKDTLSSESVVFKAKEELSLEVWLDDELIEEQERYSITGRYLLKATDKLGNVEEIRFTIISKNGYEL
jgi:hypothetical protein